MNMILKTAIGGALALGTTSAFAAYTAPNTGSSDLVLIVQNSTTQSTYELDTGISVASLMPGSGSFTSGATLSTALAGVNSTIAESGTLSAFLSANPASGDQWELAGAIVPAGNASNGNSKTAGLAIGVFTSYYGTNVPSNISQLTLAGVQKFGNGTNISATEGGGLSGLLGNTEYTGSTATSTPVFTAGDQQKYGDFGGNDMSLVGSSSTLFGITGNGGTGQAQSYILGSATLSTAGVLTITGNSAPPAVPLPAAVWLLGSGLMGLVGVSRRRKAAASA